ncbi:hypothetical protein H6F67_05720 [Microcoleus sp. FACHB-1515]|uniref:hypothetical protein n=1 Tax=Cyanophyceae TaxID=3028117 RepID=UPI0016864B18|nr:hypothetical protein [Microcoleus sp. FACHB-1515]MBD2089349.1 hypothetical protein [Microcoleus sp. FACHB-1515]
MGKRSIRFDDDVEEALQKATEATGMTFTQLVNEGMRAYLLNDEDKLSLYNLNRRLQAVEERLGMAAE